MTEIRPYVALGDSVAAGIGSQTAGERARRAGGYPVLVSQMLGVDVSYQAARAATIEDVRDRQIAVVGPETRLVTLTVGAEDFGLHEVAFACLGRGGVAAARAATRAAGAVLPPRLDALLVDIRSRAPKAALVVTGYPCPPLPRVSRGPAREALRTFVDELDDLVLAVAAGQGATPVDLRAPLEDAPDRPAPLHGPTWPLAASFHPTQNGHERIAQAIVEALAGHRPERSRLRPGMTIPQVISGPDRLGTATRVSWPMLLRALSRPST